MIAKTKRTVGSFEAAIAAALILIGAAAYRVYEVVPPADEHQERLISLSGEYSQFGKSLNELVKNMDASLSLYLTNRTQPALNSFNADRQKLIAWLNEQTRLRGLWLEPPVSQPSTRHEAETTTNAPPPVGKGLSKLLDEADRAYTNYISAADYLVLNSGKPLIKQRLQAKEQFRKQQKDTLLKIAHDASVWGARGEGTVLGLSKPQTALSDLRDRFQHLKAALLLALTGLCVLLLLAIYRRRLAQAGAMVREQTRQHEEQQEKLDKLAHFGQLAQELAHEIKQPLTAINARLYTLQKTLAPGSDSYKDATVISSEIRRLDRVVKDFLLLARPTDPNLVSVTADEALREIHDLMASQLAQESIEFKFQCEEGLRFQADMAQLKQVFINLVKNAAESVGHEGTIALRARKARRHLKGDSIEVAVVEVEDTGPGIPEDIREKIFDPFFSTKKDGTGLGLAIAARIIDKHGGVLEFETHQGRGTIFRIVLPAGQREPAYEQSTSH